MVCRSSTCRLSIGPFGDRLTWPPASGAVATKNICWPRIQLTSLSSISPNTLPMHAAYPGRLTTDARPERTDCEGPGVGLGGIGGGTLRLSPSIRQPERRLSPGKLALRAGISRPYPHGIHVRRADLWTHCGKFGAQSEPSSAQTTSVSTCTAARQSASDADSVATWLAPVGLRTNTIAAGRLVARMPASWPA